MSDELLVRHCAPTLAGIKTGSLFNCPFSSNSELNENIRRLNNRLTCKGLRVLPLRCKNGRALIYVYRPKKLKKDLTDNDTNNLLTKIGYSCQNPDRCIVRLKNRINLQTEFPHEIGLFLGYPPEDVIGFMNNKSCKSKCSGCWKVYGNEKEAQKIFARYKKCTALYCRQLSRGKTIEQLTVSDK